MFIFVEPQGQAEVRDFDSDLILCFCRGDKYVEVLEVAVDDASLVDGQDPMGQLLEDVASLVLAELRALKCVQVFVQ